MGLEKKFFGETIMSLEKPKFFIERAQAPIFSLNCGLINMKPKLLFIQIGWGFFFVKFVI